MFQNSTNEDKVVIKIDLGILKHAIVLFVKLLLIFIVTILAASFIGSLLLIEETTSPSDPRVIVAVLFGIMLYGGLIHLLLREKNE